MRRNWQVLKLRQRFSTILAMLPLQSRIKYCEDISSHSVQSSGYLLSSQNSLCSRMNRLRRHSCYTSGDQVWNLSYSSNFLIHTKEKLRMQHSETLPGNMTVKFKIFSCQLSFIHAVLNTHIGRRLRLNTITSSK